MERATGDLTAYDSAAYDEWEGYPPEPEALPVLYSGTELGMATRDEEMPFAPVRKVNAYMRRGSTTTGNFTVHPDSPLIFKGDRVWLHESGKVFIKKNRKVIT